ncbi:cytochrome C biogenesis protein [Clostridiales bacterium PH28_bin88]|nr:cytochrome C biogenesis protein [Clostridiales bacterium PH28_bin88]
MADIGYLAIILSLAISIYSLAGFVVGLKTGNERIMRSAKGGVLAIAFLVTVASLILIYFLVTSDFSIKYVYEYTSKGLPTFYKFSAFWAGNAGSMLLWMWILGIYAAVVAFSRRNENDPSIPYVNIILLINSLFFLLMLTFIANPFARTGLGYVPAEGRGLNPLLQNPGMVFHPVTLYLGYVGFAIPYAFAMAALIIKKADDSWIRVTRRWSVVAWMFLTLGNLYGGQWAYVELGWGGYWGWDPVENASFIPWLTGTAFIHSVMIQERKEMLKAWNISLIIITYLLTLFGTYLVRSGVLVSVHAFGDTQLGYYFFTFIIIMMVASLYLMIDRINLLKEGREFESYISRESSFLLNNLLLVGSAFAVFWGTIFPLVSEAVRGVKVTVSVPFFNQVNAPILLGMLLVMGVCPLIAWQKSSLKNLRDNFLWSMVLAVVTGVAMYLLLPVKRFAPILGETVSLFVLFTIIQEFVRGTRVRRKMTGEGYGTAFWRLVTRNRRRYGGYIVHLGIVLMAIGIIASHAYKQEITRTVTAGEKITLGKYTTTFNGLMQREEGENVIVYADMPVSKDGKNIGAVMPEKVFYELWDQPSTEVGILGSLTEDFYVILSTWDKNGTEATFKVIINPMVAWVWIGGYILVIGTVFAVWPGRGSQLGPKYTRSVERHARA